MMKSTDGVRAFGIAAVQVASVRGDIDANVATHAAAMVAASHHGVSALVFPELSLTGYEPTLAAELAITSADRRLEPLRALALQHQIHAIVGAPLKTRIKTRTAKPALGAILIQADGTARTYRKMHLGSGEISFFEPGDMPLVSTILGHRIGIAICGDSSQSTHPETYVSAGADIYAAGVFLNAEWYGTDVPRLAGYAERYTILTVMANHAASVGSYASVGKSAIWTPDGALLVQADGTENALLIARNRGEAWQGEIVSLQANVLPVRDDR